jgi:hypothetical protein
VEPRSGGANGDYQVIATFPAPVTATGASLTSGSGSVGQFSVAGSQVTMQLSGVTNAQTATIAINDVSDGVNFGCVNIPLAVLVGDTNGNRAVTATDIGQVKAASGQPVTASNFRLDVTASGGSINASDIGLVKSLSGTQLPPAAQVEALSESAQR